MGSLLIPLVGTKSLTQPRNVILQEDASDEIKVKVLDGCEEIDVFVEQSKMACL
jgi:hypothetical protein